MALAMTACGSDGSSGGGSSSGASSGGSGSSSSSKLKIGLAYDVGGRGDKSFNDLAAAGLDAAKKKYNLSSSSVKELEATNGESDADKQARLTQLADNGFTTIIAVGFAYNTALGKVAAKYPNVKFAIIDDYTPGTDTGPNISNLTFAEEQGSYLVGVIAAAKSKTGSVGYVGGVQTELLQKFEAGFVAGAKATNPNIKVATKYLTQVPDFSGFNDPVKGQTAADGMYDAGADIVYAAAGGSGTGVFKSAKAKNKLAIGVDSDQYNTVDASLQPVIISSMLKRVDVAVTEFLATVDGGTFKSGQLVYDLKVNGVGYSTTGGQIDDATKTKVEDAKAKIIAGTIKVPTKP